MLGIKIQPLVSELGELLKAHHLSLATAESCTGGGLAYSISKNPRYSAMLERGFIVYSNPAKEELLHVKSVTLQVHGAMSEEVAIEMAQGALERSAAQVSIATTGIAGPDVEDSEQGMVWICCCGINKPTKTVFKKIRGNRQIYIEKVIKESIKILKNYIEINFN